MGKLRYRDLKIIYYFKEIRKSKPSLYRMEPRLKLDTMSLDALL